MSSFLKNQIFVSFDTETTGLWAPANRVIEIGAVKFRLGSSDKETFQTLINPERSIPEEVIKVHGITDEMVSEAETITPVLNRFIEFSGDDSILIAHNAPFDISFISCELERAELNFGNNPIIDTIDIYKRFVLESKSMSLLSLSKQFNIADFQNHRALADAELVRGLFEKAASRFPIVENQIDFLKHLTTYTMSDWKQTITELPETYQPLVDAKDTNQKVRIFYAREGEKTHLRDVWPKQFYGLKSKYYMRAFCEKANHERTFRLDRIKDIEFPVKNNL